MTVKSWFGQPVAVTKWFVSHDDDIDLALGLLEDDAGLPLLNISSASDIIQGMELSAVCIRNSVKVALPAKVIYVDENRSHALTTNAGGSRGYSGTGFLDSLGRLCAVHVGKPHNHDGESEVEEAEADTETADEAGFNELVRAQGECMGGLRLATTGLGSHVNSCIRLIDKAAESRSARHIDEARCREGWRIFHSGNLTQPVDYIEKCVDHFAGRSASAAMCTEGWKKEGAKSDFVDQCAAVRARMAPLPASPRLR